MPPALELTDDVAFMIVVSGGGEDSIEQMAYQLGQRLVSVGGSAEDAALFEQYGPLNLGLYPGGSDIAPYFYLFHR